MKKSTIARALAALFLAGSTVPALATDGYFSHGYGIKAQGMGGASVALAEDAFGGANNPASAAFAGGRLDLGLTWFSPRRQVERSGSAGGLDLAQESGSTNFFVPEFAYNQMLSPNLAVGVAVYGNGGMNTDWAGGVLNCGMGPNTANALCGSGRLGVDLSQLLIAPTVAYKFNAQHALGVSPLIAFQRFKAQGLHAFDNAPGFPPFTSSPGNVTNRGYDSSLGYGLRLGYQGRLSEVVSIGVTYASKIKMDKFDKYRGLFADAGGFDIPEHYAIGVALRPMPGWLVALDLERINYSGVNSVGNPSSVPLPLGAANGPGFGWQDVDVLRLGVQWQMNERLALRAGYNRSDNPVRASDVTFNILAPGVVRDHLTLGATYALGPTSEISLAYMHAFKHSVTGSSMFNGLGFGPTFGGTEKISMYQNSLGLAWATRF